MTVTVDEGELRRLSHQLGEARVNVELETEGMTLNIGPQHPATHGTLRIVVKLDGEQVIAADPVLGYMHRGYEKLVEVRTYPQVTTLVNLYLPGAFEGHPLRKDFPLLAREVKPWPGLVDVEPIPGEPEEPASAGAEA